ncbi:hypothetical protein PNEG_01283 [Pneumocystis murina B123]|uniref:BAR domain-containing protein n=1 Tax=Pneumocystis murina (strain B123) TaxID=1069680 RepID=M7NPE0_PNEMU|nr:hypothetical protein PNEG_01283 [Pneumocystis murina B123]EMR10578.1 hypothetical protein PNEG_01283 [Pneumocystis murina B123]
MDAFKSLHSISLNKPFSSISPFAKRTAQLVRQTIGTADNLTELPEEYLELERYVDQLKVVYTKLLSVTSTYDNESYDYPANLRETFSEFSKSIQEKVQNLATAHSATEVQAAFLKPTSKGVSKTLPHALSRAAMSCSEQLDDSNPLKDVLMIYADAQDKIGNSRLKQDSRISESFNGYLTSNLATVFSCAAKARKNVNIRRIDLDSFKSSAKTVKPEKHEQLCRDIEHAEDVFVTAVEEAIQIMKNALEIPELILQFREFVDAQLCFHKEAYEILLNLSERLSKM